jgi:DNA-3-methyladenine glycosylase II
MRNETAIQYLIENDPVLAEVILKFKLPKRKRRKDYFLSLCRSIIGQQLSVKAAATIIDRYISLLENEVTPERILKVPKIKLRKAGLSESKALYLKNLARFAIKNKEQFEKMNKMADEEVITFLVQVKGVGRWTAEMFLIFTLGREDVFSQGDLGLQNAIRKLYGFKKPSERAIKRITDKWKPYRSHASLYLWASLDNN